MGESMENSPQSDRKLHADMDVERRPNGAFVGMLWLRKIGSPCDTTRPPDFETDEYESETGAWYELKSLAKLAEENSARE